MPVRYWVEQVSGIFYQVWEGHVTPAEIADFMRKLELESAGHDDTLVDVSAITGSDVGPADIRTFSEFPTRAARVAIVAPQASSFGLARMFEILLDVKASPATIRVFRDRAEAEVWLRGKAIATPAGG